MAHPYCRTCGSRINGNKICPYCGCEPMMGNSFCFDCGTSTLPQAIMCVQCGATLQRRFPAVLSFFIGGALLITILGGVYFFSQQGNSTSDTPYENTSAPIDSAAKNATPLVKINELTSRTITNNILLRSEKRKSDIIKRITRNIPPLPSPESEDKKRIETIRENTPPEKTEPTGKLSMNSFSSAEVRKYNAGCSYFLGQNRGNIVFFTTNLFGYIKISGRTYELQGIEKGSDIARFSGSVCNVSIEIEGLNGNEKQWLAACTMTVSDKKGRLISREKIYSSCIEF